MNKIELKKITEILEDKFKKQKDTGYKDADNKSIREGDIIMCSKPAIVDPKGIVIFTKAPKGWLIFFYGRSVAYHLGVCNDSWIKCKIIGSWKDNPERRTPVEDIVISLHNLTGN